MGRPLVRSTPTTRTSPVLRFLVTATSMSEEAAGGASIVPVPSAAGKDDQDAGAPVARSNAYRFPDRSPTMIWPSLIVTPLIETSLSRTGDHGTSFLVARSIARRRALLRVLPSVNATSCR